jgi:MFS family permease
VRAPSRISARRLARCSSVTFGTSALYKTVRTFYYLALLRNRSLLGLLAAELVSLTGTSMTFVALPWFVLATTGSAAKMGWVLAVELAPLGLFGIVTGSLVARLGAKRSMLLADAARGPLMTLVPVLWWTHHLSFPALLAATFAIGSFTAIYLPSSRLILPEVLGEDERLVARGSAILAGGLQITQILGPVLAGVLIAATSPAAVLVVDAGTYVFSFLVIGSVVRAGKRIEQTGVAKGVLAGFRFLAHDPLLGPLLLVACLVNMIAQGLIVGINALAFFHYGANAHVAGFLFGAIGVGALAGALAAHQLTQKADLLKLAAFAMLGMPLPLWLLAIAMPWGAAMVVVGVFSFFSPIVNAPIIGILTVRAPAALRPKVMSAVMTVALLAGPLGYLAASQAVSRMSIYAVFLVIAASLTVGSVAFAFVLLRNRAAPELVPVPDVAHS